MPIVRSARGVIHEFGGEAHSGWLPPGAATPLPNPIRRVILDIVIEFDGAGYLLIHDDGEGFGGDSWFETLAQAEEAASEWFGIGPDRWDSEGGP